MSVVVGALALFAAAFVAVAALLRHLPVPASPPPQAPIPASWSAVVARCVPLARGLTAAERERLLQLVGVFLADKHFEGCLGLTVTEEMKITIAAEACLLLLHLDGPVYPALRTVLVYPGAFVPKSPWPPTPDQVEPEPVPLLGESLRGGVVVLSWDDVLADARDPAEGRSVVLHEFAHQLDQEDGAVSGAPLLPGGALRAWARVLAGEFERLERDAAAERPGVLDAYGATDKAEFFAVATEAFFAKPAALAREHPELYAQLRGFYRQDPARRASLGAA
ncbi:MAG TPA: M90 family metallopeptidase [Gemmatimonadales bacterium]|nr:M90 family metallopeptidase [Gemmatimonadales bacterium]